MPARLPDVNAERTLFFIANSPSFPARPLPSPASSVGTRCPAGHPLDASGAEYAAANAHFDNVLRPARIAAETLDEIADLHHEIITLGNVLPTLRLLLDIIGDLTPGVANVKPAGESFNMASDAAERSWLRRSAKSITVHETGAAPPPATARQVSARRWLPNAWPPRGWHRG